MANRFLTRRTLGLAIAGSLLLWAIPALAAAPTVSGVSPTSGPSASGTSITISGSNFVSTIDSYTKLLLHFDGSGAAISDSEPTPKAVTANAAATQSTAQSEFGGSSLSLPSGSYLTLANSTDWEFGSGDFTVDWWEYRTSSGGARDAIARDGTSSMPPFLIGHDSGSGTVVIYMSSNGSAWDIASGKSLGSINLNTWNHLAVVRQGNNFYAFKNGTLTDSWTSALAFQANANPLSIGRGQAGTTFQGYLDEVRISKGIARWTSNFTAPTAPYANPTATIGGTPIGVQWVNTSTLTGVTPVHVAGAATVVVTNPDGLTGTLAGGFTYIAGAAPVVSSISPVGGPASGGTNVTITGSNFSLLGAPDAVGGAITYTDSSGLNPRSSPAYPGGYTVHTFTTPGSATLSIPTARTVEYLVIAGGGAGGGNNNGGGGGAGGYLTGSVAVSAGNKTVTVGAGGIGSSAATTGANGGNSVFDTVTATGGGGGGSGTSVSNGATGGSGGGGNYLGAGGARTASPVQGNIGAAGVPSGAYPGGGGGGAGAAGSSNQGGAGLTSSITGVAVTRGGGGSGGWNYGGTAGGAGGGGKGAGSDGAASSGTANTGGGGGGDIPGYPIGGSGGSGIVVVRYPSGTGAYPTVAVGGVSATNVGYIGPTSISFTSPAHSVGAADVVVTNPDSASSALSAADVFTYAPPPSSLSVVPSTVLTTGGDSVTILGSAIQSAATVTVNAVPVTAVFNAGSNSLTFAAPVNGVGTYAVVVTNPDGQSATVSGGLTYVLPPLSIANIIPSSGGMAGGTSATITGVSFGQVVAAPNPASFAKTWYVSTSGSDSTGNGTLAFPYASLNKAVNMANSGDAIDVLPGTYHLIMFPPTNGVTCIDDLGKQLTIFGSNSATILECYPADVAAATSRDANVFWVQSAATVVSNLKINYYPNRAANYSNAIFKNSKGTFRNIYVENKSTTAWSYVYDNSNTQFTIINSVFNANGYATSDYQSNPVYTNDLFSYTPSLGTKTNTLTRAIIASDWDTTVNISSDLLGAGNASILNPDSSVSNIGVRGGLYDWDGQIPKVTIGGRAPSWTRYLSSTSLQVTIPPRATIGPVDVKVTNPDTTSVTLAGGYTYTYDYPAPTITSVTPNSGQPSGGLSVTVSGTNFRRGYAIPNLASFPHTWYVSVAGSDSTGTGSAAQPFASLYMAVNTAYSGDAIYILPGTYRAIQFATNTTTTGTCINDLGKQLTIFGSSNDTILECYAADTTQRDANVAQLQNALSIVSDMKVNYYPNRASNYSNAIFAWTLGTYKNLYVENKSTTKSWSYTYDNNGRAFTVSNSLFNSNGRSTSDYSGTPTFINDVFDVAPVSGGTRTYSVVRSLVTNDWDVNTTISGDLAGAGSPSILNPDGTRSNIGVRGGPNSWEGITPVTFGGVSATNVRFINSTTLQMLTPAHPIGTVDVVASNPDGQTATLTNGFMYFVPPTVTGVTPGSGLKTGGDSVTITGTNFTATPTVTIGGALATSVTFINSTTLSVVDPPHTVGTYDVTVTNPNGGSSTLPASFSYTELPPSVTGVSPASGAFTGGTPVTITGVNLARGNGNGPTLSRYHRVWYLSPTGSDSTGDGSKANPLATFIQAQASATDNDAIIFLPGTYTPAPITTVPTYREVCISDLGKKLDIFGSGPDAIITCTGGSLRDLNVFNLQNANSSVNDLYVNYIPTKGTSYSNAIFTDSTGTYNNIYVENNGGSTQKWSYDYDNAAHTMRVVNSTFRSNTWSQADYSGNPTYVNDLFDVIPTKGTFTYYITRAVTAADINSAMPSVVPADLADTGDPSIVNPDGSRSHIGVLGGLYAWGKSMKVYFGGVDARIVSFTGGTTAQVIAPPHSVGTVDVQVTGYDGQSATLANSFTYLGPPGNFTISPVTAPMTGGTAITLTGSNFVNGATVSFAGISATNVTYVNSTIVTATTPAIPAPGTYDVVLTNPDGQTATLTNGITITQPPPVVETVTPLYGPSSGGTSVIITGTAFNNPTPSGASVTFGGTNASSVTFVNPTTITATTPAHTVGTVAVKVTNGDGQNSTLAAAYSYLPDKLVIISAPLHVREGEPGTLVVQAQDYQGNAAPLSADTTVSLFSDASTGFFAQSLTEDPTTRWNYSSVVIPAGQSSATFYYYDNLKGAPTITASAPRIVQNASQQEGIISKYRFLVTGITNPIKQGIPSSVTFQAVDYSGQPLPSYTGSVHFTSNDTKAILPPNFAVTPSMLGGYTFVNGVTMLTQGTWCVTLTDLSDANITGSQCSVLVNPPPAGVPTRLKFITSPQFVPMTGQSTPITVQLQDISGNPATALASTTLYMYTDSGTASFSADGATGWTSAPFSVTVPPGVTSANFYYKDPTTGAHAVTATDDATPGTDYGLTNDTQTETVTFGAANLITVLAATHALTAGATTTVTAMLKDSAGNVVSSTINQPVYASVSGSGRVAAAPGGPWAANAAIMIGVGQTTGTFYVTDTAVENLIVTVSDSVPPDGSIGLVDGSDSIAVTAAAASAFSFASPAFEADAGSANSMTVRLLDPYGNQATRSSPTTVYLYASQAGGTFSSNPTFSPAITSVSIPAGQSSASFYYGQMQYSVQSMNMVTASDNAVAPDGSAGLADASQVETIDPGAMHHFLISGSPRGSAGAAVPVTFTVANQYGVAIPFSSPTTIYLRTSSGSATHDFSAQASPWTPTTTLNISLGATSTTFYYEDQATGSPTITIADEPNGADTGIVDASSPLTVYAGAPTALALTSAPFTIAAGQASPAILLKLQDQYGNLATTSSLAITLSSSSSGRFDTASNGSFVSTTTTLAAGQSSLTLYYKDLAAGSPTLTFAATGVSSATQQETVTWGTPAAIAVTGQGSSIVAGVASGPYAASIINAYGVPIPAAVDTTISLTTSSTAGRFDISGAGAFDGSLTSATIVQNATSTIFWYRDTRAGTATVTVSASGVSPTAVPLTVAAAAASSLAVTSAPFTIFAGQASPAITVTLRDTYGNTVPALVATAVNLSSDSSLGLFASASAGPYTLTSATIPQGQSSATLYYKDGSAGVPTLTFSSSGLTDGTEQETVNWGSIASIHLAAPSTDMTAGTVSAPIEVSLRNAYGVTIPAPLATTIALSSNTAGKFDTDASGAFDGSVTSIPIPAGNYTATFYYADTHAGSPLLTASKTGVTAGTLAFNVVAGAPAAIAFSTQPRTVAVGAASQALSVQFLDSLGNVRTLVAPTTLTLTSTDPSGEFATSTGGPWTTTTITLPAGSAGATFYYRNTVLGVQTIDVSAPGLTDKTQNISVVAGPIDHLIFTSAPQTLPALTASAAIQVEAVDSYGNPATAAIDNSITLTSTSGTGKFSVLPGLWSNITTILLPALQSTATFYYKDSTVGTPTITVQDFARKWSIATQSETIVSGAPAVLHIGTVPQTVITGTPSAGIQITLMDGVGNLVSAQTPITMTLTGSSGTAFFTDDPFAGTWASSFPVTFAPGDAMKVIYFEDANAGTFTLTASATGLTAATQLETVLTGTPTQLAVTTNAAASAGQATPLSVEIETGAGLPVAPANPVTIPLSDASGGQFSLASSPFIPIPSVTIPRGVAQANLFYRATAAGTHTIVADASASGLGIGSASINILALNVYALKIVAGAAQVPIHQASTPFTVLLEDMYGNIVPVSSIDTGGTGTVNAYLYGPGQFGMNANGPWNVSAVPLSVGDTSFTFYYQSSQIGSQTILVSDQTPSPSADTGWTDDRWTTTVLGETPTKLAFSSSPRSAAAGDYTAVTIEADKADGTPALLGSALTVSLSSTWTNGTFTLGNSGASPAIGSVAIPAGQSSVTVYVRDTTAGSYTLSVAASGLASASQTLTIFGAAPWSLSFLNAPKTLAAGAESTAYHLIVLDRYGNAATSSSPIAVTLAASDGGELSLSPGAGWSPVSNVNIPPGSSDLYFYLRDQGTAGTFLLTASPPTLLSASQSFTVQAGVLSRIVPFTTPFSIIKGAVSPAITFFFEDAYGNIVALPGTTPVYLYSSSLTGSFSSNAGFSSPSTVIILAPGAISGSFFYRDLTSGVPTLTMSDRSPLDSPDIGLANGVQTETVTEGSPYQLVFTDSPSTIQAGTSRAYTLELENQAGVPVSPVAPLTVYLTTSSAFGRFSLTNSFQPSDFIHTVVFDPGETSKAIYYKDGTAGASTVIASDATPPDAPDIGILNAVRSQNVTAASVASLNFLTVPLTIEAGQVSSPLVVGLRDLYGNSTLTNVPVTVYLYSSSGNGSFSLSTSLNSFTLASTTIPAGQSAVSFYYRDTLVGSPVVTVADASPLDSPDSGLTNAVQTESVTLGNVFRITLSSPGAVLESGAISPPMTVELDNASGVPRPVASDTQVYLSSSNAGGQFATSPAGPWNATTLTISAGQASSTIYYRQMIAGSATLTVSDDTPPNGPTGWLDATQSITVAAGLPTQIALSAPASVIARHPSAPIVATLENSSGAPTAAITPVRLYLRSSVADGTDEFALGANGPWGVNYVDVAAGSSQATFYVRGVTAGTRTLTAADELPVVSGVGLVDATAAIDLVPQTMDHILVTNISDPQIQGQPSTVVVEPQDAGDYIYPDYAGTVCFTASDADAILPPCYTFVPLTDQGVHSFGNSVSFRSPGEKWVRVDDSVSGFTGSQDNITVVGNTAGPLAKLKFIDLPSTPVAMQKGVAFGPITLQLRDSNDQPVNALTGGYPIRFTSDSPTGQFATAPGGPWSTTLQTLIPESLSSVNVYYKDSTSGSYTINASDWLGGVDNPSIADDAFAAQVSGISLTVANKLIEGHTVRQALWVPNNAIFSNQDSGTNYEGRATFDLAVKDDLTGTVIPSTMTLTWSDTHGAITKTDTLTGGSSYHYVMYPIGGDNLHDIPRDSGNWHLAISAVTGSGITLTDTENIPVSDWRFEVDYLNAFVQAGSPVPFTAKAYKNDVLTDASETLFNWSDDNGNFVAGTPTIHLSDMTRTSVGQYSGSITTAGLTVGKKYYLISSLRDSSGNILAEDSHGDVQITNTPALAAKDFRIEKVLTSQPGEEPETFSLIFRWTSALGTATYHIYTSNNKFARLYADPCTIVQVQAGQRASGQCEKTIDMDLGDWNSGQWQLLATIPFPATSWTLTHGELFDSNPMYFLIRSDNGSGQEAAFSTMLVLDKKAFAYNSGGVTNFDRVSLPYTFGSFTNPTPLAQALITDASQIVQSIEGALGIGTTKKISAIGIWNPVSQSITNAYQYKTSALFNRWVGSAPIQPSDSIYLQPSGNTPTFSWAVVGSDQLTSRTYSFNSGGSTNFNWVSLPYTSMYKTAFDIVRDIEGCTSIGCNQKITAIGAWNPSTQAVTTVATYKPGGLFNRWVGDFTLVPGEGVYLQLAPGVSDFSWTPALIVEPNI